MAKIRNTSVYPNIPPTSGDYFVVTDVTNNDNTKTVTIGALSEFLNGGAESEVVLSSTDIKNLNTVPKAFPILDFSVGAGTALIMPISCGIVFKPGAVNFNFSAGSKIRVQPQGYTNPSVPTSYFEFDATLLNNPSGIGVGGAYLISPLNTFSNASQDYIFTASGADQTFVQSTAASTQGDGSLRISFQYRLISTT